MRKSIEATIEEIVQPIVDAKNFEIVDIEYVKEMVPNVTEDVASKFKILQPGNCIAFGSAFSLPLQLKLDIMTMSAFFMKMTSLCVVLTFV